MRIVVVEDSPLLQELIVCRLEAQAGLIVTGTATSASEALELVLQVQPDAVLIDVHLAPGSGLWVLEQLREQGFRGQIYMLSNEDKGAYGALCRSRGADGYYDKTADIELLTTDLREYAKTMAGGSTAP